MTDAPIPRSSSGTLAPPTDLAERIELYLDDAPMYGGHSDKAGGSCWELLREAMEELRSLTPQIAGGVREAIAEIIDPMAFKTVPGSEAHSRALHKADAILALSPQAQAGETTALTGAALARWCYDNPNLAAGTIEGLRAPAQPPTIRAGYLDALDALEDAATIKNNAFNVPEINQHNAQMREKAELVRLALYSVSSTQRCTWPNCDQPSGHDYCYSHCLADRGAAVASTHQKTGEA